MSVVQAHVRARSRMSLTVISYVSSFLTPPPQLSHPTPPAIQFSRQVEIRGSSCTL